MSANQWGGKCSPDCAQCKNHSLAFYLSNILLCLVSVTQLPPKAWPLTKPANWILEPATLRPSPWALCLVPPARHDQASWPRGSLLQKKRDARHSQQPAHRSQPSFCLTLGPGFQKKELDMNFIWGHFQGRRPAEAFSIVTESLCLP